MVLVVRASAGVIQYDRRNAKLFPCKTWKRIRREGLKLHPFLTSAPDGGKWSTLQADVFTPGERKLTEGGPHSRAEFFYVEEEIHFAFWGGIEIRTISL